MKKELVEIKYKCGHKELMPVITTAAVTYFDIQYSAKRFVCPDCRRDMK